VRQRQLLRHHFFRESIHRLGFQFSLDSAADVFSVAAHLGQQIDSEEHIVCIASLE